MSPRVPPLPLWDRYTRLQGRVHLTGLQAIVRLTLDQVRRDRSEGRRVGVVVSGYPGSPVSGLDQYLRAVAPLLEDHDVRLVPGLNEELATSIVGGTQLVERFAHSRYDGVVGIWYGKAPGLDRSLDAIRHCNFMGTARYGGVLSVVGDDPGCKSSSLPSHSEHAFAHAFVPLLTPSDAQEVLESGLHGIALSRFAGLWVGLRVVADIADGGRILDLQEGELPVLPKVEFDGQPFRPRVDTRLLPPHANRIEEGIVLERLEAVRAYARANKLNRIVDTHHQDRVGLIAAGWLFPELLDALERLGLDERLRGALGLRLLKLGIVYPLEPQTLRNFADGLEQIIVVDERRGFVEDQVRAGLSATVDPPPVVGQRTERGEPWLARLSELSGDTLAVELGTFLGELFGRTDLVDRARRIRARGAPPPDATRLVRSPYFCSGCPHTRSTLLPEGSVAGGGIGCHIMAILMERGIQYTGAMGSEGAHWIGLSPFVDTPHIFQNLGDGTYFHSGRLGVRACVEAGVRMTFKILHNHRIAMTGGQEAVGRKPIAAVVRDLLSDGVRLVVAVSDDPELRSLAQTNPAVECVPRHRYAAAMQRLATEPGVTALVYDELCANEKQRLEKQGELPRPTRRPVINEDVCEGCGDCGARSACLSVRPVQTELGPKRRIHLTSCTDDLTCLEGDCPSFLSIGNPPPPEADRQRWIPERLPAPPPHRWGEDPYRLFLVGVGSTGVVTANAILMRAAELEGHHAHHLDQMGLAQRGGRVLSQCTLGRGSLTGSPRVGWGLADTLLAFDPLGASDASGLRALSPERTWAIVHSGLAPTAEMVTQTNGDPPDVEDFIAPIEQHTMRLQTIPAESLAEAVFGTSLPANVIQLGFSCQLGAIPLRPESLEQAIVDREVAVEDNRTAFRLGRAVAADPSLVGRILADELPPTAASPRSLEDAAALLGETWHRLEQALEVDPGSGARSELLERIGGLALELGEYQDDRYARRYLETLIPLAQAERNVDPTSVALTEAAARELYRLMAYKDEYEVARLLMSGPFRRWLERRAAGPLGLRYHLSPLLLRALGLKRKIAVGGWAEPVLRTLAACRRLRGTFLDPFGWMPARRLERELVSWYEGVLATLVGQLTPGNVDSVLEIVRAPAGIRGFDEIKGQQAAEVRRRVTCLVADLTGEPQREEST